jgi:hypothetical protein
MTCPKYKSKVQSSKSKVISNKIDEWWGINIGIQRLSFLSSVEFFTPAFSVKSRAAARFFSGSIASAPVADS